MKQIIIISLFIFINYSSVAYSSENNYKIPAHVFVFENLFFPGAGHIYNDHLRLAFVSFFTTTSMLAASVGKGSSKDSENDSFQTSSLSEINYYGSQKYFLNQKEKKYNKDFSNTLFFVAILSYLDGFVESYYAANNGWEDNLFFSVAGGALFSGIKTSAVVNNYSEIANGQDAKSGAGLIFSIKHGRLFEKDMIFHLGPHFVFSYDITYYLDLNNWASIFIANQFDLQKKIYDYAMNFNWTSYDKYQVATDHIVIGASLKPLAWIKLNVGLGVFNVATIWRSFADNPTDPFFSQKHVGTRGGFSGKLITAKADINFSKSFFVSARLKYLDSVEAKENYDATSSYLKFFRAEGFLGYYF